MHCYSIKLNSIKDAEKFAQICNIYHIEGDVDISQGKYLINGKSLLGLLSLNLLEPMLVKFELDENNKIFIDKILQFAI